MFQERGKEWKGNHWENRWVGVVGRGESFHQSLPNKPVGHVETFLQAFLVNHDAADSCRLYVTTMEAMNFRDDFLSIPIHFFKTCTKVWFDINARCYWKVWLTRTSWRTSETGAKLYFSSRTRYWTHCIGERNSLVAVDKFVVVGKNIWTG